MPVPSATVEARPSTVPTAAAVVTMKPGTCADKHAPRKIIRAVVAVRCAGVRSISVVAIRTYRSRPNVGRAKLNRDLRVRRPRHNHEKPEQNAIL
jgi:hypothetical protein